MFSCLQTILSVKNFLFENKMLKIFLENPLSNHSQNRYRDFNHGNEILMEKKLYTVNIRYN